MGDTRSSSPPAKPASSPTSPDRSKNARTVDAEGKETGTTLAAMDLTAAPPPNPDSPNDIPPPKPPRPLSSREQAENTLKEAFPAIDASVIKAVLTASGGQVEPAFNALLGMSDPDSQRDPEPPVKPPRPSATTQSQLEADETYARQLHEHYHGASGQKEQRYPSSRMNQQLPGSRQRDRPGAQAAFDEDRERNFIDDDLPVIRDNIKKGFLETQSTVNKWVMNLKKKIDGEDEEDFSSSPARPAQTYGARSAEVARRSADRERYDADPQVLGDDFLTLELRDAESTPSKHPSRPLANPNLFKSGHPSGRKVSFQEGPPQEIGDLYSDSRPKVRPSSGGKSSKWQPMSAVEPSPVAEDDPFSLGDSDDEKDAKAKDNKNEEADRLQNPAADAMSDGIGSERDKSKMSKS